jgi:hypothetical protein
MNSVRETESTARDNVAKSTLELEYMSYHHNSIWNIGPFHLPKTPQSS